MTFNMEKCKNEENFYVTQFCILSVEIGFNNFLYCFAGWGTIYYGGPVATTLQEVTVPVWKNSDCDKAYEQDIVPKFLCAGVKAGGKDSCQVRIIKFYIKN